MKHKNIIINGGYDSAEIDEYFNSLIPENGRALIFTFAKQGDALKHSMINQRGWIPELRTDITPIYVNHHNAIDINIDDYDALFLAGGETGQLLDAIHQYKMWDAIQKFRDTGKPIYGNSAGAIIMGERADIDPNVKKYTSHTAGMNWLKRTGQQLSVISHYPDYELEYSKKFCADNGLHAICVPERQGAIFDNDGNLVRTIGDGVKFL